jgi:hypothetical protein
VELGAGVVVRTYTNAPAEAKPAKAGDMPPEGVLELDVAKGGEVLEVRVIGIESLFEKLRVIEPKPKS